MKKTFTAILAFLSLLNLSSQETEVIHWDMNSLDSIGGFPVTLYGEPVLIHTDNGPAIEFDGVDDGLLVPSNPMAGATEFTIEVIFMPYSGGLEEQRFVHFQQDDDNRALIELRSTAENKWFLDTFIKSAPSSCVLYADNHLHDNDQWWHAALVYRNDTMVHFVNGENELDGEIKFVPVQSGSTSLGVRQNLVSWYKGAIRCLRVSHRALEPDEFLFKGNGDNTSSLQGEAGSLQDQCRIYPNPASGQASIRYCIGETGQVKLKLYDSHSIRAVSLLEEIQPAGDHIRTIDLEGLNDGFYFYSLETGKSIYTGKFLLLN